jgi:hypothetical protein
MKPGAKVLLSLFSGSFGAELSKMELPNSSIWQPIEGDVIITMMVSILLGTFVAFGWLVGAVTPALRWNIYVKLSELRLGQHTAPWHGMLSFSALFN